MPVQEWTWFGGFVLAAFLHTGVKATGGKAGLSYWQDLRKIAPAALRCLAVQLVLSATACFTGTILR